MYRTVCKSISNCSPVFIPSNGSMSSRSISKVSSVLSLAFSGCTPSLVSIRNLRNSYRPLRRSQESILSGNDFAWWNGDNSEFQSGGNSRNDTQPPVPVESSQVMNVSQADAHASIRIAGRFYSRVGLYILKPILKLLGNGNLRKAQSWKFLRFPLRMGNSNLFASGGGSVP